MIRINQLKVPVSAICRMNEENDRLELLKKRAADHLKIASDRIQKISVVKQSMDCRKKPDIFYVYCVDITLSAEMKSKEAGIAGRSGDTVLENKKNVSPIIFPESGNIDSHKRIYVVGSGPAGLFCAWKLIESGYRPIVLERGPAVEERAAAVDEFWRTGILNTEANVQFGEGGAGTFSDGKLNTMVKDPEGHYRTMLEVFVQNGAPEEILYKNKPHIGTDCLRRVIVSMREHMKERGAAFCYNTCLTDLKFRNDSLCEIQINHENWLPADICVLATGHSARDTFEMLLERGIVMEPKPFAMGVRIEHPQTMINDSQYGEANRNLPLPPADYKLTGTAPSTGRSVFSFCMCPGGFVVNASSEQGRLAVNGMSNHARDTQNANSAVITAVTPDDFPGDQSDVLRGMRFQRTLEENAYRAAQGKIPMSRFDDFRNHRISTGFGEVLPSVKGQCEFADVRGIFPEYMAVSIEEGIVGFERKIKGFSRKDALMYGVESRTSSPVRVLRNDEFTALSKEGLYPCGEGAGYAGGISSAAMDGMKVAAKIVGKLTK